MSIIIKGMEMPISKPYRVFINPNGQVFVDQGAVYLEFEAVEIQQHGDLIDRDEAMNAILGEPTDAHYPSWFAGIVNDVPAVIPAERSEDDA